MIPNPPLQAHFSLESALSFGLTSRWTSWTRLLVGQGFWLRHADIGCKKEWQDRQFAEQFTGQAKALVFDRTRPGMP